MHDDGTLTAMTEQQQSGVCVICARPGGDGTVVVESEKHPKRTYKFFIHRDCLKEVAKPGFAGLKDL